MDKIKAEALIEKYKLGTLSTAERQLLNEWYTKLAADKEVLLENNELEKNLVEIWANISAATKPKHRSNLTLWKQLAVAGVVLLLVGLSLYFYRTKTDKIAQQQQLAQNIKPGGNRATLTLANGKVITLDDAINGKLAEQSGIVITKTKDGQLIYATTGEKGAEPKFNTIATPKGGQYQVLLPDGSKVWLNAASSLTYPTYFTGNERKVTLAGEAYFEVAKAAKNNNMPFVVRTGMQDVTVLGTSFNINAYHNEAAYKTTLLEGAVKVTQFKKDNVSSLTLKPGQQSSLNNAGFSLENVNAEDAVAWKNGMFLFKDADLKTVMRSIARWYDVEVEYEGTIPNKEFSGEIYRNLNLAQVLEILNFYKVQFRVEGRTIIVSNK